MREGHNALPRPGLEPGSSDSEPSALTTGLLNKAVALACPRSTLTHHQEPITWSFHLPYLPSNHKRAVVLCCLRHMQNTKYIILENTINKQFPCSSLIHYDNNRT
ncbi:hypothetical protein pdam_00012522 [Pocillopora damicornis]|uniref:Uncharacterized protein n=1 Tax=Pocillopora damicornis TaxID=46731 RepID=A0A3M6UXH8_POCDA|nr:hypothetical protein pdam_00012522 [Pocillopora damicornis]